MFHYHFMQNAYLAGTCLAVVAGVVGYFVVIRSQAFASHAFANVGFAGAAAANLTGLPIIVGLFASALLAAFGVHLFGRDVRSSAYADVAIGAVFILALSLGFLFVHLDSTGYSANIYNILFGNALGIADREVWLSLGCSVLLLVVYSATGRAMLFASIDPEVANARGVPVRALSLVFLVSLAMVVAVAVLVVGVLLIFALLVTPAATASRLSASPIKAILIAVIVAVGSVWAGLLVGYYTPWPVSFFITSFAFGAYVATLAIARVFPDSRAAGRAVT